MNFVFEIKHTELNFWGKFANGIVISMENAFMTTNQLERMMHYFRKTTASPVSWKYYANRSNNCYISTD